jgi:hypothetical protein
VICRLQTLVFQFAEEPHDSIQAAPLPGAWMRTSLNSINLLFAHDADRRQRFLRFLRAGAWGLFLVHNSKWAAYGWCTSPGGPRPPHLPRWSRSLGAHWIFSCHTRTEFRRKGFYRRMLRQLVDSIRARTDDPLILCDTLPENFASRGAVLRSGFIPRGVVNTYYIGVPYLGGITFGGCWRPEEPHWPEMAVSPAPARKSIAS